MLINWFVVLSQIVNFIIVILVLKFFLYRPILEKIRQHQKKVEDELKDAAQKQKEAKELLEQMKKQKSELDFQTAQKKKEIKKELDHLHDQLLENAKQDVAHQKEEWTEDFKRDQQEAYVEYKNRMVQELFSIVRKSIESLSHLKLEEAIISAFLSQLKEIPTTAHLQVKTALDIPEAVRQKIKDSLKQEVEFIQDPQLVAGIALYIDGKKMSWNVEDYLTTLQKPLLE
jgi:F-type H+-transporting ATPase subunit b